MYKTPQKDSSNAGCCINTETDCIHNIVGSMASLAIEVCSVCLSPCGKLIENMAASSSSKKRTAVETKCKHHFHESCLNEAKAMKPECPMCRCPLTPLTDDRAAEFPNLMRQAVVSAAQRGRNAVRERMLRLERERAQNDGNTRPVE